MRIAILGKAESWHVQQHVAAVRALGHVPVVTDLARLRAEIPSRPPSRPAQATLRDGLVDLLTVDRVLVRRIPPGSLEQVVARMDALHRVAAAGIPLLNPPAAIEACVDKYLATARLHAAGLPVPRTIVCEGAEEALAAFADLGGDVVVKPLFGSEGRGLVRVADAASAYRVFHALAAVQAVLYLQEFIPHQRDVRVLVLGEKVLAAMQRLPAPGDFRTNVACGGRFLPFSLPDEWAQVAIRAARAVGAILAGVDLLPRSPKPTASRGEAKEEEWPLVVEVNSTSGFRALAQTTACDLPGEIIRFLVDWA